MDTIEDGCKDDNSKMDDSVRFHRASCSTPKSTSSLDADDSNQNQAYLAQEFVRVLSETDYAENFIPTADYCIPLAQKAPTILQLISRFSHLNYVHRELPCLEADPHLAKAKEDRVEEELCELLGQREERTRVYCSPRDVMEAHKLSLEINIRSTLSNSVIGVIQNFLHYYDDMWRHMPSKVNLSSRTAMKHRGNCKALCSRVADAVGPLRATMLSLVQARNFIKNSQELNLIRDLNKIFLEDLSVLSKTFKMDSRISMSNLLFPFAYLLIRLGKSNTGEMLNNFLDDQEESESKEHQLEQFVFSITKGFNEIVDRYSDILKYLTQLNSKRLAVVRDLAEPHFNLLRTLNLHNQLIDSVSKELDISEQNLQNNVLEIISQRKMTNISNHQNLIKLTAQVISKMESTHKENMAPVLRLDDISRKDLQEVYKAPTEIVELYQAINKCNKLSIDLQTDLRKFQFSDVDVSALVLLAESPSEFAQMVRKDSC